MASNPKIRLLLKNVEAFVKNVPIDPKAKNYKKWRKNQAEAKKALNKATDILGDVRFAMIPASKIGCGIIPTKQASGVIVIAEKKPLPVYLGICRKVPTRDALKQIAPSIR